MNVDYAGAGAAVVGRDGKAVCAAWWDKEEIATRYLGKPADILGELRGAGFEIMESHIDAAATSDDQNPLRADARKPAVAG